jgi:lipopolysaccharide transport system ATP-binding protein
VDFAGVERYIDTPVKRYSSGMYVRLAFGVAAHLEPEILIVDEVLAVGDAEFQKKALGKMKDVSGKDGRTVLFVSHNMVAVETLCNTALFIENGLIKEQGTPTEMIKSYLQKGSFLKRIYSTENIKNARGNENIRVLFASIENASAADPDEMIDVKSAIDVRIVFVNNTKEDIISVGFDLNTAKGDIVFGSASKVKNTIGEPTEIVCRIPGNLLNNDLYQIHLYFHTNGMSGLFSHKEFLTFEVKDVERDSGFLGKVNGLIRPVLQWEKVEYTNARSI